MSFEKRNSVIRRAAIALDAQAANPIAIGEAGLWFDGSVITFVDAAGTQTVLGSAFAYGLVGAMAAAGVAAANAAGVAAAVARIDHVHAPDTTLVATTTNTLEMTGKTLTAMVVKTGLTASGSATNDFSDSTGAFKTSTGVNTQGGLSAAGATTRQVADPGASGAISVATDGVCNLTTAGAETRSLAIPTFIGQQLLISMDTKVGNATLTIAGTLMDGTNNTVIFSAVGQSIKLEGRTVGGTRCWALIANNGTALSHV